MDKHVFENKILELGKFKRRKGAGKGIEDFIFVVKPADSACPDCLGLNRNLIYELKRPDDRTGRWRTKCIHCKNTWPKFIL